MADNSEANINNIVTDMQKNGMGYAGMMKAMLAAQYQIKSLPKGSASVVVMVAEVAANTQSINKPYAELQNLFNSSDSYLGVARNHNQGRNMVAQLDEKLTKLNSDIQANEQRREKLKKEITETRRFADKQIPSILEKLAGNDADAAKKMIAEITAKSAEQARQQREILAPAAKLLTIGANALSKEILTTAHALSVPITPIEPYKPT